ncbi:MAG: pyridoxal-phosphate dependent enzyme [Bacteroidales bacterium]|nr:pyridoxal-phosphate dependent enzyme [Bacteroidales bacterium]
MDLPVFKDIQLAHSRIREYVHRTPVLTSSAINSMIGAELFFKCENFQKVGAFKYRGATNAVLMLEKEKLKLGVATHSSGNHAAALALAARKQGVPSYIVMPENAPDVKIKAVKSYGAEITFCKPDLKARESGLREVIQQTGASFIHPFDNFNVICGQGTAVKELLEDIPAPEIILAPVGGGGLFSGTVIAAKAMIKNIQVIAAEPENADDACRSFHTGHLIPSDNPITIADGLLTSLSELTFTIIRENADNVLTASEEFIVMAMRIVWERMKIVIEPSSAVPLAVLLQHKELGKGKRIGIILSGGNVDLDQLSVLFSKNEHRIG